MSIIFPRSLSRLTLAGLVGSFALAGTPASAAPRAKPARAKPARAKTKKAKIKKRVVKVGKAHIGGSPVAGNSVAHNEPDEVKFTLSANTPNVPYRGRLIGHYPREWRPTGDSLGPGGEVWLSQNQVPHGSYAVAKLRVEKGHEYEVTLCTWGGGHSETVRATVGDATHTFPAGDKKCDVTLVLQPEEAGWTSVKIDFAEPPSEHGANAFVVLGVEVVRR